MPPLSHHSLNRRQLKSQDANTLKDFVLSSAAWAVCPGELRNLDPPRPAGGSSQGGCGEGKSTEGGYGPGRSRDGQTEQDPWGKSSGKGWTPEIKSRDRPYSVPREPAGPSLRMSLWQLKPTGLTILPSGISTEVWVGERTRERTAEDSPSRRAGSATIMHSSLQRSCLWPESSPRPLHTHSERPVASLKIWIDTQV